MKKQMLAGMLLGAIFLASFFLNIFVHELGHYSVAKAANLEPEIHLGISYKDNHFYTTNFYVSYSAKSDEYLPVDILIALAGPLANISVLIGLLAVYFKAPKKTRVTKLVFAALLVPTILSIFSNLLPFGGSDGSTALNYFVGW